MSFLHLADKIRLRFGRYKVGAPTTNSQPGAHTGNSRQYIPGYSDSNIVYLDTASGNDSKDGSTELLAKRTYASAATAAGSTKKIRVINDGAALSTNITKPTEMKRGVSGTISGSTATVVSTWTAQTPGLGTPTFYAGGYSRKNGLYIVAGSSGSLGTSPDGITWTSRTSGFGSSSIWALYASENSQKVLIAGDSGKAALSTDGVTYTLLTTGTSTILYTAYIDSSGRLWLGGDSNYLSYSDDDGANWEIVDPKFVDARLTDMCFGGGIYVAVGGSGTTPVISTSSDGINWVSRTHGFGSDICQSVEYDSRLGLYIVGASSGKIGTSPDGINWTQRTSTLSGDVYDISFSIDLGIVIAVDGSGAIASSPDAITWTGRTSGFGASQINVATYSSALQRFIIAGGSGKVSTSAAPAEVISASVCGFSITGVSYSGSITAYNCTVNGLGSTASINLNSCRITESGCNISNNAQSHFGTLFEGDAFFTSAPASQNAFALNCNTFGGSVYLYNSSATNYEQIRDNVIVGDFTASFAAPMLSGNLQGTNTNGILAKAVTLSDPAFVNTTDYKLKRLTNGDSQDSPLCNASVYYVNEQGQPRDMGAWSEDDSENAVDYRYSYFIDKPAGNGIRPQKIVAASADQGMDGTWDSVNEPERASEYLTLTYSGGVSREHVVIQDLLESLIDMTCEVSLTPDLSDPDTAVTVNGNHSIGDIVLNIDASSTIKAGMVLPIGGVNYFILYTASGSSPTKLVLHKPLESAVSDNTVVTPQEPPAYGTYQYIPQSREIPRPTKMETDYVNGVSFKFVRQYPQV